MFSLDITRESLQTELESNDILLNVVVWADYELVGREGEVVMGVDSEGTSYILEPDGEFSTSTAQATVTQVMYLYSYMIAIHYCIIQFFSSHDIM